MDVLQHLMPKIGDRIGGRYRIESVLGEGGFGVVYVARQENLDRQVAVKMLLPAALADRTAVARFQREVDMVRRLEHPNTVRIFDRGETEHKLQFYVMELVKGRTLAEVLADEGPLPPARVKHIAEQVLMSLGEAHSHGIVHRDLKPGNIMLTEVFGKRDHVKVLDFGIGKVVGGTDAAGGLTTQGLIGTPYYMSPEQAKAQADIDGRSDLYALGLIMHETLTRRRAIDGPSPLEVVMNHVRSEPVHLDPFVASGHLGQLIATATAKDRDARFASAQDMLTALINTEIPATVRAYPGEQAAGPDLAGTPRTPGSMPLPIGPAQATAETIMAPDTPLVPSPSTSEPTASTGGTSKSLLILALLFIVVAVGVFFLVRRGGDESRTTERDAGAAESPDAGIVAAPPDAGSVTRPDEADVGAVVVVTEDVGGADAPLSVTADAAVTDTSVSVLARVGGSAQVLQQRRQAVNQALSQTAALVGEAVQSGSAVQQELDAGYGVGTQTEPDAGAEPVLDEDAQLAAVEPDAGVQEELITVEIRGTPSNAHVRVDGETVCRRLPCEVTLPPGEGTVRARISATNYMTETIRLRREPGRVHHVELWRTFD